MEKSEVKELWGVEFSVVPNGLSQEEVVSFVNNLMEQARKAGGEQDRQTSLLKLAEQTVVEADKLAESIKQQSRQEAEEEAAKVIAAAQGEAAERVQRLIQKAERDGTEQASEAVAKAEREAQELITKARKEAQLIVQAARDEVPGIESEAKLEAEYIVRRFTVKFVEEIRSVVTESSNNMLPSLDDLTREAGHGGILDEGSDSGAAITPPQSKAKSSSKPR